MDYSMPGLPVLHHLLKFARVHVHPAISSSDTLFSFCPRSFPASGTFPVSQLFTSGDQNTGASPSASVLPMSIQGWFPLRLTSLISSSSLSLTRGSQEPSLATHSKAVLPVYTGTLVILSLRLLTRVKENQLCTLDQTFMRYLHLFWNILSKFSIYKTFFLLGLTKKTRKDCIHHAKKVLTSLPYTKCVRYTKWNIVFFKHSYKVEGRKKQNRRQCSSRKIKSGHQPCYSQ